MKKLILMLLLLSAGAIAASAKETLPAKADSLKAKARQDSAAQATAAKNQSGTATNSPGKAGTTAKGTAAQPMTASQSFWTKAAGYAMIIFIVGLFLWLANKKNLLKDAITDPAAFLAAARATLRYQNVTDISQVKKSYSLSRSQLGIWTIIISCSYIYVDFCTDCGIRSLDIDATLLSLMGISAGTAAVGSMIDAGNNQVPHHQDGPSDGFFTDIVSDQNGISIHRLQNVLWTLVAIIIYIWQLPRLHCGQLPTLDQNLVALTGISSLTYLGLKVNENKPPTAPVVGGGH
jgi:hypothetical protein